MIKTYYDNNSGEIVGVVSGTEDALWFWILGFPDYSFISCDGAFDASSYRADLATGNPIKKARQTGINPDLGLNMFPAFPTK